MAGPKVAVVLPYRHDTDQRGMVMRWTVRWWRANLPDWALTVGGLASDEPWSKGRAVEHLVTHFVADADVLVVADADVVPEKLALAAAVSSAAQGLPAMPHGDVWRLTEAQTVATLASDVVDPRCFHPDTLEEPPYPGVTGGGCVAVRRDAYDLCPLDPRFVGWGGEDHAWGWALRATFGKVARHDGSPLWHLWHPPQARPSRQSGGPESQRLRARYHRARRRPPAMRQLLAEARAHYGG